MLAVQFPKHDLLPSALAAGHGGEPATDPGLPWCALESAMPLLQSGINQRETLNGFDTKQLSKEKHWGLGHISVIKTGESEAPEVCPIYLELVGHGKKIWSGTRRMASNEPLRCTAVWPGYSSNVSELYFLPL